MENEWEPAATGSGLQMRKRNERGDWVYRDPTEQEADEFLANEAW